MTEPMTDAELDVLRAAMDSWSSHYDPAVVVVPPAISMDALLARLDAERSRANAAEAARDAALARAMPEPVLMETVEQVEALPDGNYLARSRDGAYRTLSVVTGRRSRLGLSGWATAEKHLVGVVVLGPLPDLPIPTPTQEG